MVLALFGGIVSLLLGSLLAFSVVKCSKFWASVFRLRFPILAIVFLLAWAPAACLLPGINSLAANVLLLEDYRQLLFLAVTNYLAVVTAIAIIRYLLYRSRRKAGEKVETRPWTFKLSVLAIISACVTPIWAFAYSCTQYVGDIDAAPSMRLGPRFGVFGDGVLAIFLVAVGFAIGMVLLLVSGWIRSVVLGSTDENDNFFPYENRTPASRVKERWKGWEADIQLAAYSVILILIFFGLLAPFQSKLATTMSIAAFVVLIAWILSMIFSGVAAWLDDSRFPILLSVVIWIVVAGIFNPYQSRLPAIPAANMNGNRAIVDLVDANKNLDVAILEEDAKRAETYQQQATDAQEAIEEKAWNAIIKRMDSVQPKSSDGQTLVVVTCPGGGIHAAAWSAFVLEQLDKRYIDFSSSICVISSVSGWKLGSCHICKRQKACRRCD